MENKNRPPMPKSPPPELPETYKRTKFGDPYGKKLQDYISKKKKRIFICIICLYMFTYLGTK